MTQNSRRETKMNVKFPNSSTPDIRSPSGVWARGTRNTTSRLAAGEEPFVFPGDGLPQPLTVRFKPISNSKKSPPCNNQGLTFCEDVDEYPGNYLENVFQNVVDDYQELLGTDEITSGISQRFDGSPPAENSLCASVEQVVFPKTAKTKDDKWLFIVNQGAYVQGVRIEKCLKGSEEQSCLLSDSFPNGYKTTCKQKYIYRKLVAINEDGKPITDTFQLPSCCSCTILSTGLASRMGAFRQALNATSSTTSKPAV